MRPVHGESAAVEVPYGDVTYTVDGPVARVTIDRAERRNSMSYGVMSGLRDAVAAARADDAVRVVVLTGAGERAFCAGADLSSIGDSGAAAAHDGRGLLAALFRDMWSLGKPTIARVRGYALAGGFGLALACDFVVAADDAVFGTPEVNVGLWPYMITVPLVRSMPPRKALELMSTGRRVDAAEAERIGFVTVSCPWTVSTMRSTSWRRRSPRRRPWCRAGAGSRSTGRSRCAPTTPRLPTGHATVTTLSEDSAEGSRRSWRSAHPSGGGADGDLHRAASVHDWGPLVGDLARRRERALGMGGPERLDRQHSPASSACASASTSCSTRHLGRVRAARRPHGPGPGRPLPGRRRCDHRHRRDRGAAGGRRGLRLHRDGRVDGSGRRGQDRPAAGPRAAAAHPHGLAARLRRRPHPGHQRVELRRCRSAVPRAGGDERRGPDGGRHARALRGGHGVHPGPRRLRPHGQGHVFDGARWSPPRKAAVGEDVTEEEMGGSAVHTTISGVADLEVADDRECLATVRQVPVVLPGAQR